MSKGGKRGIKKPSGENLDQRTNQCKRRTWMRCSGLCVQAAVVHRQAGRGRVTDSAMQFDCKMAEVCTLSMVNMHNHP